MRELSLPETLLAKVATEKTMAQADRTVTHYHADNGRFSNNGFVETIIKKIGRSHFAGLGPTTRMVSSKTKTKTKTNFLIMGRALCSSVV